MAANQFEFFLGSAKELFRSRFRKKSRFLPHLRVHLNRLRFLDWWAIKALAEAPIPPQGAKLCDLRLIPSPRMPVRQALRQGQFLSAIRLDDAVVFVPQVSRMAFHRSAQTNLNCREHFYIQETARTIQLRSPITSTSGPSGFRRVS